jgi:hypothetical protein
LARPKHSRNPHDRTPVTLRLDSIEALLVRAEHNDSHTYF